MTPEYDYTSWFDYFIKGQEVVFHCSRKLFEWETAGYVDHVSNGIVWIQKGTF